MATTPKMPTFKVTTIEDEPYIMKQLASDGSVRYVGFVKDLMDALADKVGFDYKFQIVADKKYGSLGDVNFTGMIGEVQSEKVDIAAGALTVTAEREEAVDFTKPFLSTSVNLLVQKPHFFDMGLGYLVRPFSLDFWVLLLVAIVLVGFLFFVIGKFSPYEWIKVADDKDLRGAKNAFSLRNSYLFVLSSVTWQGFREPPRSISGRFLAAFWWIFVLFTLVAYTANLTAYLLARPEQMPMMPFKTYEELVDSQDISAGALSFGATQRAMQKSRDEAIRSLWTKMSHQNSWVTSNKQGLDRVQKSNGHFVMFMETRTAEYLARQNCDVMVYGADLFPRQYALATKKGSPLTSLLSDAIVEMKESGAMDSLIERWWRFSGECSGIDGRKYIQSGDSLTSLPIYPVTLRDMAVAILLLFLGIIVAVVFLVVELIYHHISTGGKIEKPKVLDSKIFKAPKFTKSKKPKPGDAEAGTSEPLTDEALEGTSGEPAASSGEGVEEVKEA